MFFFALYMIAYATSMVAAIAAYLLHDMSMAVFALTMLVSVELHSLGRQLSSLTEDAKKLRKAVKKLHKENPADANGDASKGLDGQ